MVLDESTGVPRLLISCAQRRKRKAFYGGINYYILGEDKSYPMPIDFSGNELAFCPHGIAIAEVDGKSFLYAINHGKENSRIQQAVLRFVIGKDKLYLDQVFKSELLRSPNDLFVMSDGSFYVTNDTNGTGNWDKFAGYILKRSRGSIVYFDGRKSWSVVIDYLKMPNGIRVLDSKLYATLTRANQLVQFDLLEAGRIDTESKKVVVRIKGGDNINFDGHQSLLTTSHSSDLRYLLHTLSPRFKSPTKVYQVDIGSGKAKNHYKIIFTDNGEQISAGSTALIYRDKLYISQVFEGYILEVTL